MCDDSEAPIRPHRAEREVLSRLFAPHNLQTTGSTPHPLGARREADRCWARKSRKLLQRAQHRWRRYFADSRPQSWLKAKISRIANFFI